MTPMRSGPAGAPLISPSLLRTYGLRSALIFVLMIVGIGAGTFMLREAASAVAGHRRAAPDAGDGPSISAWLNTPGGIAIAPNGDIYFADSNNDVIDLFDRRLGVIDIRRQRRQRLLRRQRAGHSAPSWIRRTASRIAPDGDLIVADSHNDRIRRVDRPTRSSPRLPDRERTATTATTSRRSKRRSTRRTRCPRRRTATSTSPTR